MTRQTPSIMNELLIALAPGIAVLVWFFGIGVAINVLAAVAAAIATETLVLVLRGKPLAPVFDSSAIVTGILIGVSLPPLIPVWVVILGVSFALLFGKHVYGGLGHNPFNPAMAGYAMLIVAFPLAMTLWPAPGGGPDLASTLAAKLGAPIADGITRATPLDAFKFRGSSTVDEFYGASTTMTAFAGAGWQWANAAFLAGGICLLYRRTCHWLMPAVFLGTLAILAALFYDSGSSGSLGSPIFHLFSGATMLAAFFILTDPVTSPDSPGGQVLFAVGAGVLTFIIRSSGAYPDGIAFAVLLMNTATPFIDQFRWRYA